MKAIANYSECIFAEILTVFGPTVVYRPKTSPFFTDRANGAQYTIKEVSNSRAEMVLPFPIPNGYVPKKFDPLRVDNIIVFCRLVGRLGEIKENHLYMFQDYYNEKGNIREGVNLLVSLHNGRFRIEQVCEFRINDLDENDPTCYNKLNGILVTESVCQKVLSGNYTEEVHVISYE
jgi:hypothetical protein